MTERSYTADDLRRRARLLAGAANRAQLAGSHNRFAATTSDGERYYLDMADLWRRYALECLFWANCIEDRSPVLQALGIQSHSQDAGEESRG